MCCRELTFIPLQKWRFFISGKLETLYQKYFGVNPSNLRPKPSGAVMQTTINRAKRATFTNPNLTYSEVCLTQIEKEKQGSQVKRYKVFESGKVDGQSYMVLAAIFFDGEIKAAVLIGDLPAREQMDEGVFPIAIDGWFEPSNEFFSNYAERMSDIISEDINRR